MNFQHAWQYDTILCKLTVLNLLILQAITSTGSKKGELFLADVGTKFTNKNITTDVKVDTNSNVSSNFYVYYYQFSKFMIRWIWFI